MTGPDDSSAVPADAGPRPPLITRCPACGTAYRVRDEQLTVRDGQVRCGHCSTVFDARACLIAPPAPPVQVKAETPERADKVPEYPQAVAVDSFCHDEHALVQAMLGEPVSEPPTSRDPADPSDDALAAATVAAFEPGVVDSSRDLAPSPIAASDGIPIQGPAEDRSENEGAPPLMLPDLTGGFSHSETASSDQAAEPADPLHPREIDAAETDAASSTPPARVPTPAPLSASDAPSLRPEMEFDFARRKRNSVRSRLAAGLGAMLLATGLLLQAGFHFRGDLALLFPQSRDWLENLCRELGCTLPLPRRSDLLSIESSDLQADGTNPSVMVLSATLRNKAPFAQMPPALELTLTDVQDRPVARRVLTAADYLPRAVGKPDSLSMGQEGFPADSEWPLRIRFDASSVQATGYRLYLFHP